MAPVTVLDGPGFSLFECPGLGLGGVEGAGVDLLGVSMVEEVKRAVDVVPRDLKTQYQNPA